MADKTLRVTAAQIEESVEKSHNHSNLSTLNNITSSRMKNDYGQSTIDEIIEAEACANHIHLLVSIPPYL